MSIPDAFAQMKPLFVDDLQHDYEAIRPIVLGAATVAERSRQTEIERTTLGDKARRFAMEGMRGLADQRAQEAGRKGHGSPDAVAAYMLYVKQLYPPIHLREIERIVQRKFGYKTNHHTIKHFFARYPIPVQLAFDIPRFSAFADAYDARWTVVRMAYEGWNKQSIAGCLMVSRTHVAEILHAFERDGFEGLEDQRTRSLHHPDNQLILPFLKEVLDLQHEYPRAGRFRIYGLLEKQRGAPLPSESTVGRAMAINRRFHGAPGPWQSARDEQEPEGEPKHLPYRPHYRHHFWYVDIRYLVKLDGHWISSICMLEGYSRAILAGMAAEHQDLPAVLHVLFAALSAYGCPAGIVSDHGSVFRAGDFLAILKALGIAPTPIEKRKPWQNFIEPQLKIQLRLADYKFEQAQTVEEIQQLHAAFIDTLNTTRHWAHQDRVDGCRTSAEVLGGVRGRTVDPEYLRHLFERVQVLRTVNRYGFVSVHRFSIYAERGLARQRVSIWISEGQLRIEYRQTLLAHYRCAYDARRRRLTDMSHPTVYNTAFASPQIELIALDDAQWVKVQLRPPQLRTRRLVSFLEQLSFLDLGTSALILLLVQALWRVGRNFFPNVTTFM